jgi:hypothetical protein
LDQLTKYIDAGLKVVAQARVLVQKQLTDVRKVAETLDPKSGGLTQRRRRFAALQKRFCRSPLPAQQQLGQKMARWAPGLFVGGKARGVPRDNLDLERFFRLPKGHERRIHGHKHVGMRVVREGPTLIPTLDAHQEHAEPFTTDELLPFRNHPIPVDQIKACRRHQVMRQAASTKQRPELLRNLEMTCGNQAKIPLQ